MNWSVFRSTGIFLKENELLVTVTKLFIKGHNASFEMDLLIYFSEIVFFSIFLRYHI